MLEDHLREFSERGLRVLTADESPSVTILCYVSLHFDFISARPYYPVLFQRLMMTGGPLVGRLARKYFLPLGKRFLRVIERGVRSGEFRPVNSRHTAISLVALTVFYSSSAPIVRRVGGFDPFQPAHLARRKREVLNFIRHGLFRRPEECEA